MMVMDYGGLWNMEKQQQAGKVRKKSEKKDDAVANCIINAEYTMLLFSHLHFCLKKILLLNSN
jgi:hypothetical protein